MVGFRHPGCNVAHRRVPSMVRCIRGEAWGEAARLAARVGRWWIEREGPYRHPGCEVDHREVSAAVVCLRRLLRRRIREEGFSHEVIRRKGLLEAASALEWVPSAFLEEVVDGGLR